MNVLIIGDNQALLLSKKKALTTADRSIIVSTTSTRDILANPPRNGMYDCIVICSSCHTKRFEELVTPLKRMMGLPIIVYTEDDGSQSLIKAFKLKVTDYIIDNPNSISVLAKSIRYSASIWRNSLKDAIILRILNAVNEADTPHESVEAVLKIIKGYTDAEALAIRLRSKGDFPYYATLGFPPSHVASESSLLVIGSTAYLLDCMCGHVIQGRTNPKRHFFTERGSFFTGSSSELACELGNEASKLFCRANCLREGYESIALIPLKKGSEIIGLLQVNDQHKWKINSRLVYFLEELASGISIALQKADAEVILRDSEELFRTLLEKGSDPISISVDNVIVYANRRRAELSGFSDPSKMIGHNREEFAEEEDVEKLRQLSKCSYADLEPFKYEYRMKTPNGPITVEASNTPIIFKGKNAAINILHDVTEAKKYQEKIIALYAHGATLASADKLNVVVKTTLDACQKVLGFRFLSFMLIQNGVLTSVSSRGAKPPKRGLPLEGKGITVKAAREKRTILVNDLRVDPDYVKGPSRSLSEMAAPVLVSGEPVAVINIEDDHLNAFTEVDRVLLETLASNVGSAMWRIKHREEDTRMQAERTRELLESANRITAMVRHDLRGPLQTIKSASYLLNTDPSRAEALTQTIDQSVEYASKILDDLRSNTTPVELQKSLVNLNDLVEGRVKMLVRLPSIKVKTSFETDFIAATVDPDRIRRVLDNLLKNAVEAMPSGGTLTVSVKQRGSSAVITIGDTGTGIPPEIMANLFKPFYSGKVSGTGLGLAFSKQAIEAHDGSISVKTKVGAGTTFTVELPLTSARKKTEKSEALFHH